MKIDTSGTNKQARVLRTTPDPLDSHNERNPLSKEGGLEA